MFQFTNRAVCVVALSIGCFAGSVFAAKGGISDQTSIIATVSKKNKVTKTVNTIGRTADSSDPVDTSTGGVVTTPTRTCDFSGFAQNDSVNRAYAGGTSNGGTAKMNNQMSFTGAVVINTYNGSGEPNSGIAYSPAGKIVIGLENFSASQISFSYSSSTALTVNVFSSNDGSGSAISTTTFDKTLTTSGIGGPFVRWTAKNIALTANAHSISFVGIFDRWGIDQVVVQVGVDCNNNGVPDATDIANGTSQDCNGNGIPDSCDIASGFAKDCNGNGVPDSCDLLAHGSPAPGAVQWRVEDGGNGHWYLALATNDRVTWEAARDLATTMGGHLATLTTASEDDFVFSFVSGRPELWSRNAFGGPFLGAYQLNPMSNSAEGWTWVTGEPWNYTKWAVNEPGDQAGPGERESFLQYRDGSGGWNDIGNCTDLKCFYSLVVEWETTQALDCNGNNNPDSCDIASGNSRDVNLNGIPDECEAPANLTLTNDAGACNHAGGSVNVDATLSGVLSPIVSGQIYISWNPANMSLNSITAGDAPFDQLPLHTINQSAGTALLVTSIALGQPPVSVISKIVARMQFTIRGGTCDGSGTDVQFFPDGTLPTTFTDGLGSELVPALVASSGFKVDDTSPVFSNVPAAVSVNADAGEGAFARVALIAPTATDACGAVTQTSSRSDGAGMDAMYAVGTTTVTWSTTDLCGNTSTATTSVTVKPYNTARFQVQYLGVNGGAATRSFVTTMRGSQISLPSTVNGVSIANGAGEFFVTNAPIDSYFCATVEDAASTLRRRVSVTDAGTEWNVVVTLLSGDVINDEVVDVLDWGAYVVRNVNADLNMDNSTNDTDGDMILAIFGQKGDTACGSNFTDSPEPVTSISIAELVDRGMADLVAADLNNDGWLDMADIELSRR